MEVLSLGHVLTAMHSCASHVVDEGWSPSLHFELEVHLFALKLSKHRQSHHVYPSRRLLTQSPVGKALGSAPTPEAKSTVEKELSEVHSRHRNCHSDRRGLRTWSLGMKVGVACKQAGAT